MERNSSHPSSSSSGTPESYLGFAATPRLFPVAEEGLRLLPAARNDDSPKVDTPHARPSRVKRPHTKSRRGCFNCKQRRIKCQETKPACANCMHKEIECVYPSWGNQQRALERANGQPQSLALELGEPLSASAPLEPLSLTPFTVDDLRFFHHFLLAARPDLPFGNEHVWMTDIPAFAHDCPHLMHAILSLGATHYSLITPNGARYFPTAITHRGKALQYLNAALAKGDNCTVTEMDGILATCYTLCFQAFHMDDGMVDFAVMVRGCSIITDWFLGRDTNSRSMFTIKSHEEVLELATSWFPPGASEVKDRGTIEASLVSLALLEPLLQTPAHHTFYDVLQRAYIGLKSSLREAFVCLVDIYSVWHRMENIEFLTFIAPANYISRALFMHYIAVDVFMRPVYVKMSEARRIMIASAHFLVYKWADTLYRSLPVSVRELVSRPADFIAAELELELEASDAYSSPEWARELTILADWLQRRSREREISRSDFQALLII